MPRVFAIALMFTACMASCAAMAQSLGYPEPESDDAGGGMPSLSLPQDMTNPTLSGLGPDDASQGAPIDSGEPNTYEPAPYSVEGEETLDPGGN